MRNCKIECEFWSDLDLFGKPPEFFYKGKSQLTSIFGRVLTIIYVLIYIAFFIYKLVRMIGKLDIDFYETYAFTGIPSISLSNQNFYAGFSIGGIMDKTLYYPVLQYWVETRTDGIKNDPIIKNIDLEICKLEKFGKEFQDLLKDKPLQNFYCIKNVDDELIGYGSLDTFSYYYIMLFPCIDEHPDGTPCKPLSEVTSFFQKTFLEFTVQDIELTPKDYDNPSQPLTKDITTPVFQNLYQSIFGYFQIVNLETNLDILGFEAVSENKNDIFLKYDQSWIIASPSPHSNGLQKGVPVCDVMIQLAAKVLTIKRANTKLIDVLGDVGGLMEFIQSLFNIISLFITDLIYDIDIVKNLFSFDLTKKKVLIKNNNNIIKKEMINIDKENLQTLEPNILSNKIINENEVFQNDICMDINSNPNIKNIKEISVKKKGKRVTKKFYTSYNNNINETVDINEANKVKNLYKNKRQNNKMNEQNVGISTSNHRIISDDKTKNNNIKEIKEEKGNIIENIYINNFFIIFAFCCIRKIKNVNSYLLEEGLNIIKARLDILNIFKNIYYVEQIQESYKNKNNEIEMSNNCKNKFHYL